MLKKSIPGRGGIAKFVCGPPMFCFFIEYWSKAEAIKKIIGECNIIVTKKSPKVLLRITSQTSYKLNRKYSSSEAK
jgi:hypothetical protein